MAKTPSTTRRRFLQTSLLGAAATSFPAYLRAQGANEDVRIAVVGTGGQGSNHIGRILPKPDGSGGIKGCRLVAACDVDTEHAERNRRAADQRGVKIDVYTDYRKLLENKDIDAIVIATPNHTHSVIAVHALQAGKHVYTEKPISHNIWEGRQLVKAAQQNPKLIAMHGMQRRSSAGWHEIYEWIWDKNCPLGKLLLSRGLCYKLRDNIGKCGGPQQPPPGVDYDLWSGPREILPIMRKNFHYDWHWQWPYGNGDIGNQGPHQLDIARWMIGDPPELPTRVRAVGGRLGYDDDATTANTQIVFYDYKPVPIIMEVRGLPNSDMNYRGGTPKFKFGASGVDVGNVLHFEGGMILENAPYDKNGNRVRVAVDDKGKEVYRFGEVGGGSHLSNFVTAIREGRLLEEGHGMLTGHLAAALAHMGNISYRIGKVVSPGAVLDGFRDDPFMRETLLDLNEHLKANKINVDESRLTLGPSLEFDPKQEVFVGEFAKEANEVATETYRPAFSIKV